MTPDQLHVAAKDSLKVIEYRLAVSIARLAGWQRPRIRGMHGFFRKASTADYIAKGKDQAQPPTRRSPSANCRRSIRLRPKR